MPKFTLKYAITWQKSSELEFKRAFSNTWQGSSERCVVKSVIRAPNFLRSLASPAFPPPILWGLLLVIPSSSDILRVSVVWFLCDYIKLLIPESLFCLFTRSLEGKQFPFLTGEPIFSISWKCNLSFLPSLFILTLLLFHSASVFPMFNLFFFFLKYLVIKHMQSVVYGLMWRSILLNPSILAFNPSSLICPHLMISYLQVMTVLLNLWEQIVPLHVLCISINKIVTVTLCYDQWIANKIPQVVCVI